MSLASVPAGITVISVSATGCMQRNRGPSNVAQGIRYQSGNAEYDQFFDALYQVQLVMGGAPERAGQIRADLARSIGADEGATADALGQAASEETERMATQGVTMTLEVQNLDVQGARPSADLAVAGQPQTDKDSAVVAGVEAAAQRSAELLGDMREALSKSQTLESQAGQLEPAVDGRFGGEGPAKKAEVKKNLQDARQLIPLMIQRANEIAAETTALLRQLQEAANATPPEPPAPPPEEAAEPEEEDLAPQPPGRKAAPGSAPRSPKPAPAPPPTPPPAADDFEP